MEDFEHTASQLLEELATLFETSWEDADVDLIDDMLTVTLPQRLQYVINKHGVTQQIWVSSPFTGAHHFYFKEGVWRCTKSGETIHALLEEEHKEYAS